MATARRLLVDPKLGGVYHCISRCVRRAFLCGRDAYSGKDFEHRRDWIRDRLRALSEHFAVEIYAYSVMSNHLHVVVRTRPELAHAWEEAEVARRWLQVLSGARSRASPPPPSEDEIAELCKNHQKLVACRARLADLSWFMRFLNEPIARRANREDECTGRFWEGRFKCQKLDDDGAALACMAYVDLNPVRAGIADGVESSNYTSIQDRLVALRARGRLACSPDDRTPGQNPHVAKVKAEALRDAWLAPIGDSATGQSPSTTHGDAAPDPDSWESCAPPPLSHISERDYLELVDWTGRELRSGKRGSLSPELRPLLEQLDLDVAAWVSNVEGYSGLFSRLAARVSRLSEFAKSRGCRWFQGRRGAELLYLQPG